jgi:uncharacterized protein YjcR
MDNNEVKAEESKVIFALRSDSKMFEAIAIVAEKAERYRNENHSVEYWAEDLLLRGIKSFSDYLDNDHERRMRENFRKEIEKLATPDPANIDAMVAYATKVGSLKRKYGIGGEQKAI